MPAPHVCLAADSSLVAVSLCTDNGTRGVIELYDGASGTFIRETERSHMEHVTGLATNATGTLLCSCDGGLSALVHNGEGKYLSEVWEDSPINCIAVSADGTHIATGLRSPTIALYR